MREALLTQLLCVTGLLIGLLPATLSAGTKAVPKLHADVSAVRAGDDFQLAIDFELPPGWHMYWLNPGDTGMAPKAVFTTPAGVTVEPIRFPVPKRIVTDGVVSYGYEGRFVLLATVHTAPLLSDEKQPAPLTDPLSIKARLEWLICRDVCVLETAEVELAVPVAEKTVAKKGQFAVWQDSLPVDAKEAAKVEFDRVKGTGTLKFPVAADAKDVEIFPPGGDGLVYDNFHVESDGDRQLAVVEFRLLPGAKIDISAPSIVAYTERTGRRTGSSFIVKLNLSRP